MRRKIAKRKRKELLKLGAVIDYEGWIKESEWKRKDIGYKIDFQLNHPKMLGPLHCCIYDYDELIAYKVALEIVNDEFKFAKDPTLYKYSCCNQVIYT